MTEKFAKSFLKVRVEELAGGYVLYQVLEQDELLYVIDCENVRSENCPAFDEFNTFLRGKYTDNHYKPFFSKVIPKKTILQRFKEILDLEGFQKSSENDMKSIRLQIYHSVDEYSFWLETERSDFLKYSVLLLQYQLWQEDDRTYFKIIHCDEKLRNKYIEFSNEQLLKNINIETPFYNNSRMALIGQNKNLDKNVWYDYINSRTITPQETSEIVKEALEKEFCKSSKNLVEFKETSPNIYEILVTEV